MSGDAWQHIRSLDETENWHERAAVISKTDHQNYTTWAQEVVDDMVDNVHGEYVQAPPTSTAPVPTSKARPLQTDDGNNFHYMNEFSDSDFQGSAAQFDVDYLESIQNKNPTHMSALARESLYVKFDPLVSGSQSAHKSPNFHRGMRISNPPSNDLMAVDTPPRDAPNQQSLGVDLLTSSPSKLTNTQQTSSFETTDYPTQPSLTTISSPHSLPPSSSSSSPHTTSSIIKSPHSHHHPSPSTDSRGRGRGERSGAGTGTLVEVLKYGEEDMAAVIEQTRQEERAKYDAQVQLLKEELSRKEVAAQRRVDRVQKECQAVRNEMKGHISNKLKLDSELEQLREFLKTNESTHDILHTHYDELRSKVKEIEQQRESAIRDFEGLDKSFADLHQRYLKLKQSSDSQQQHEKILRGEITRLEESCIQSEERLRQLQADSTQQMNEFNSNHDNMKKQHAQDVALTKATMRKLELQVESLQRSLEEKGREKEGLTQLCDELLAQINPS